VKRRPPTQKGLNLTEITQMGYLYKVYVCALKKHMALPRAFLFFFSFFLAGNPEIRNYIHTNLNYKLGENSLYPPEISVIF
jgi:hypothetical protein